MSLKRSTEDHVTPIFDEWKYSFIMLS